MRASRLMGRKWSGAAGAVAAGLGAAPSAEAEVVFQVFDPPDEAEFFVDLGNDGVNEFRVGIAINEVFNNLGIKADEFAGTMFGDPPQTRPGMAGIIMANDQAANLALGTLIGPADTFVTPPVLTRLNGHTDVTSGIPVGNFNGASGYIGVQFALNSNTHYGYVGYEGDDGLGGSGRMLKIGWEDAPDTAIEAGAESAAGVPGDYNSNGMIDAADYTAWRDNVGGTTLDNRGDGITGPVGQEDYDFWASRFGATAGAGGGQAAVPEPTSLALLAAGAAGLAMYRRRREST